MADSKSRLATELVTGTATISALRWVKTDDGKFKFQFLRYKTLNGRVAALFVWHPKLREEVKRFDNRFKDTQSDIAGYFSHSPARPPKRRTAA